MAVYGLVSKRHLFFATHSVLCKAHLFWLLTLMSLFQTYDMYFIIDLY